MIAVLRTSSGRVAIAIAISLFIHATIFCLPYLHLPHPKIVLPTLTVRLETLPVKKDTNVSPVNPEKQLSNVGDTPTAKEKSNTMSPMKTVESSSIRIPFPKHLQITFSVSEGELGKEVGELRHDLIIDSNRYTLTSLKQTTEITSLKNKTQLIQISSGTLNEQGLQPAKFEVENNSKHKSQHESATFDWINKVIHYSQGTKSILEEGTQDELSYLYQFSQISIPTMLVEFFPVNICDVSQVKLVQIEIGIKEEIATPLGKIKTLHLRKMHSQGEPYFDIWLGLEYRMLPVKFRLVEGSEKVIEEDTITDIRAEN